MGKNEKNSVPSNFLVLFVLVCFKKLNLKIIEIGRLLKPPGKKIIKTTWLF